LTTRDPSHIVNHAHPSTNRATFAAEAYHTRYQVLGTRTPNFQEKIEMVSKALLDMTDALQEFVPVEIPTAEKFGLFLEHLMESGSVVDAARLADLSVKSIRQFRRNNPKAQQAYEQALDIGTDAIEAELHRRAVQGIMEPVFYKGRRVNTVRKKSDVLLMFLLKSRRPHIYRDNAPLPEGQEDDSQHIESPAEEIARRLASISERKRASSNPPIIDAKPARRSKA
jgi:hypothetical protein